MIGPVVRPVLLYHSSDLSFSVLERSPKPVKGPFMPFEARRQNDLDHQGDKRHLFVLAMRMSSTVLGGLNRNENSDSLHESNRNLGGDLTVSENKHKSFS